MNRREVIIGAATLAAVSSLPAVNALASSQAAQLNEIREKLWPYYSWRMKLAGFEPIVEVDAGMNGLFIGAKTGEMKASEFWSADWLAENYQGFFYARRVTRLMWELMTEIAHREISQEVAELLPSDRFAVKVKEDLDTYSVIVEASHSSLPEDALGFAMTGTAIKDGLHKAAVKPSCLKMREALEAGVALSQSDPAAYREWRRDLQLAV